MPPILRSLLAVLAGCVAWTLGWFATTGSLAWARPALFVPGRRLEDVGVLLALLAASVVLSVAAGWVTGRLAGTRPVAHAAALGALQLALGVYFQTANWEVLPVWYHLAFLSLLVPGNLLGGRLAVPRPHAPYTAPA